LKSRGRLDLEPESPPQHHIPSITRKEIIHSKGRETMGTKVIIYGKPG
jgi:hypothetical protein